MTLILVFLIIHYAQTHDPGDMEKICEIYISEALGEHEVVIEDVDEIKSDYDHITFPLKIRSLIRMERSEEAISAFKEFENKCNAMSIECTDPLVHIELYAMMYSLTGKKGYLENTQQWEKLFNQLKAEQIRLQIRNKEILGNNPADVFGLYNELERTQIILNKTEKTRFYLSSWVIVHPDRDELFNKLPTDMQAELGRQGFGPKEGQINNFSYLSFN